MDKCNITCKQIVNCLKRCFTIKFNQLIYRFTVPIIALTALGVLGYIYFKHPGSKIMDTSNLLVIISIIVSLMLVIIDSRFSRRARIEPMIVGDTVYERPNVPLFYNCCLRIKNVGANAASNISINVEYDDNNEGVLDLAHHEIRTTMKATAKAMKCERYVAAGEYLDTILFTYTLSGKKAKEDKDNKDNAFINKLDKVKLNLILSYKDEISGRTRTKYKSIKMYPYINSHMSVEK